MLPVVYSRVQRVSLPLPRKLRVMRAVNLFTGKPFRKFADKYQLATLIAEGGFGRVYDGWDTTTKEVSLQCHRG